MASSFKGDNRYSMNASSPALSTHNMGNESPTRAKTPGTDFQESKFNLLTSESPYEDGSEDSRKNSTSPVSDEKSPKKKNKKEKKLEVVDKQKISGSRKRWVFFVWLLTWWVPPFVIKWIVGTPRKDVREAWREKLAINLLIWLSCGGVMFFMIGFPELICPRQDVYSLQELSAYNGQGNSKSYVAMRGVVYDLASFTPHHYPSIVPTKALKQYAGKDATNLFPVQVSALCNGVDGSVDPAVQLNYKSSNYTSTSSAVSATDLNAQYHDFRWFTNDSRPDWWYEQQLTLKSKYQKGSIGYTPQYISTLASTQNYIASIHGKVYDLTAYIAGGRAPKYPSWTEAPSTPPNSNFMDDTVVELFRQTSGSDASKYWDVLPITPDMKTTMMVCLNNLFYVGNVDTRNSTQCLFAKYILLAISILLVAVICTKFLAALQFGKKNVPENLDKFVICQVPAYTEDEESLRRAIDSAARMKYDDKRKLLVIICDGNITGEGNDRTTPRIVLDILGVSDTVNPEPLSFESLGEGQKQHNRGQVYSGLYEVQGHIVPFLVIVKVGKPSETSR
jgi:chitin synthase